jgi:hypothetical protein
MLAYWNVPSAPNIKSTQTIFYFSGLEPYQSSNTPILPPVLGWSNGSWTISSWHCCYNGNQEHSVAVPVNDNDQISGSVFGTNCAGGVCSSWQVSTIDITTSQATVLNTPSYVQAFDLALGGVLEAYAVNDCAQYPASGSVTVHDISTYQYNSGWVPVASTWSGMTYPVSPACGASVSSSSWSSVTVSVNASAPLRNPRSR